MPFAGDPIVPFAVVDFPSFHFCSWRSAASCEREGRKEETVRGEERGGPEEDATYYSCRPGASPMAPSEKMDGLRMRQRERERRKSVFTTTDTRQMTMSPPRPFQKHLPLLFRAPTTVALICYPPAPSAFRSLANSTLERRLRG